MSISGCMGGPACSGLGACMGTLEGVLQTSRGVMGAWQASGSSPGAPGACVALLGTPPGAPGASRTSSEGLREACASSPQASGTFRQPPGAIRESFWGVSCLRSHPRSVLVGFGARFGPVLDASWGRFGPFGVPFAVFLGLSWVCRGAPVGVP